MESEDQLALVRLLRTQKGQLEEENISLKGRGPGGTSGGMDGRVSRLEAHMEHVREDVSEIKQSLAGIAGKLDGLAEKMGALPTKSDVTAWKIQWTALSLAVVAITVGGIIGGLAWIQPAPEKPAAPAPIVIAVPKG